MSYGRMVLGALAATVAYYVWGFLIEGLLIRKDFAPYADVYRPAETVMGYFRSGYSAPWSRRSSSRCCT